jgi:uncharacterized cupredoxin-like copper-binding protein
MQQRGTLTTAPRTLFCTISTLVLLASAAGGCGSARRAAAGGTPVSVSERDFHISAPSRLHAGEVAFTVRNEGPDRHEFIVASVAAASVPLRTDGLTVDEETLQKREVGELEPGEPGALRTLRLNLAPGRYVFFCNMAGHYLGGMHHEVVVE